MPSYMEISMKKFICTCQLVYISNPHNQVCRLKKSLYGLKQASKQWFEKHHSTLISQNFVQSNNDYSLFLKKEDDELTILAVYVDDMIITRTNLSTINSIKAYQDQTFSLKDLVKLNYFLGVEVTTIAASFIISQHKFTKERIEDNGLTFTKKTSTPLPTHVKLLVDEGGIYHDPPTYRSLATDQLTLQAYNDSDWAACPNIRKFVTGYVLLLGASPISMESNKQGTTSKSSFEAEYRAMAQVACEVCWLVRLLQEWGISTLTLITLHNNNMSALHIVRDLFIRGLIELPWARLELHPLEDMA
ncbi:uncharacterized mitochondrial protein AtMg00810-like [Beta vulgaris subsp. vulgaris]|uniref:uncharacterized mitochondrial protein AtMg00810-like n=1 Tax=Beta vulgaris subsp. vulgaris TaxID=3555 RepID=UPI00203751CD|nr:uncharacterized mitochondrial protein AtMg00810-like [Beta vulgaris subsp. vulgaris]